MPELIGYQIDLDEEKILFEEQWLGRKDLADKIRQMIESQDYRISAAGAALEYLETSLAGARSLKVKLTGGDAEAVAKHADRAGIPVARFLRQAVQAYLASQPPLEEEPPSPEAAEAGAAPEDGATPESEEAPQTGEIKMPKGLVPLGPAKPAGEAAAEGEPDKVEGKGGEEERAGGQVLTTITTEPASPGEADQAVELTSKKSSESSKVVVDPSLSAEDKSDPNTVGDSWFKKS